MTVIRNTLAVAVKELRVLFKNRGNLAVLFLLPMVLASIFGSINMSFAGGDEGEESLSLPVALVNQDEGRFGEQVTEVLKSIDVLDVNSSLPLAVANQRVADGAMMAAVVIPAGFSARVDNYEPSTVEVIVDPTREQYGSMIAGIMGEVLSPVVVQGEIQYGIRSVMDASGLYEEMDDELRRATEAQTLGVIMTQLQRMQADPWIAVRTEDPEGVEAEGPWNPMSYNVPAFSVMFAFFLVGVIAQTLWVEKEVGTFRRLLAAPLSRGAIIGGKVLANVAVVCLQFLVLFTVGSLAFDMPLGDSLLGLVLLTVATALTSAGLGVLVAGLTRSSRQADSLGMILGFVLGALGGCIFPLYQLGGFIGMLPRLVPHGHALIGFSQLLNEGAGVVDLLPQIAVLLGMSVLFLVIGIWRFEFD